VTEKHGIFRAAGVRSWVLLGIASALVFLTGLGSAAATTVGHASSPSPRKAVVTVDVTAGKPTEFSFTLAKKSLPAGTVVFKVTNRGKVAHTFKVCRSPSKSAAANSCSGKVTKLLARGASATLTVTLKKGSYEYLCTVPGHAAAGMKGTIRVAAAAAAPAPKPTSSTTTTATPTTTPTATTTAPPAPPPATETLIGDPVDGATVFMGANCGNCHVLAAAGSTGNDGPDLDTLAPTQTAVVNVVESGGPDGYMPRYAGTLSTQQIYDVASYVYKSTHTGS
jgi:mono/diheme cytochrome c family protein